MTSSEASRSISNVKRTFKSTPSMILTPLARSMNPLNEVQKKSADATVLKFNSAAVGRSFAPHQETLFPELLELGGRIGNRDIRLALLGELGGLSLGKAERICKRFAVPGAGFSTDHQIGRAHV